jgi:hypothetical protein
MASEEEKIASLSKGDEVEVVCRGAGRVRGSPSLADCKLR